MCHLGTLRALTVSCPNRGCRAQRRWLMAALNAALASASCLRCCAILCDSWPTTIREAWEAANGSVNSSGLPRNGMSCSCGVSGGGGSSSIRRLAGASACTCDGCQFVTASCAVRIGQHVGSIASIGLLIGLNSIVSTSGPSHTTRLLC